MKLLIFAAVVGMAVGIIVVRVLRNKICECRVDIESKNGKISELKSDNVEMSSHINELKAEIKAYISKLSEVEHIEATHAQYIETITSSNTVSMPWLSSMIADFLTVYLEVEAKKLDWGGDVKREKKVASIREIRAEAKEQIAQYKESYYQLRYLTQLYPALDDILDIDYAELSISDEIPDRDPIREYISKEEWETLSFSKRDQLALDRYVSSRKKNNWQIGRDYELSVAYEYRRKGYNVDTFGSYMGLEDLGRDLIAKKENRTLIVQCKYWSQHKTIHEKHIFQLYGTLITYCIDNNLTPDSVNGVFVTNINLSEMAIKVAKQLGIQYLQQHEMVDFPRIKCNVGRDENGCSTRIYHLPMDMQYDITQIKNSGEFYAHTVQEAILAGFRRTYRWHGN